MEGRKFLKAFKSPRVKFKLLHQSKLLKRLDFFCFSYIVIVYLKASTKLNVNKARDPSLKLCENMGNTNCVASGGCPHRADIQVVNNTKYDLELDTSVPCQRECNHSGE